MLCISRGLANIRVPGKWVTWQASFSGHFLCFSAKPANFHPVSSHSTQQKQLTRFKMADILDAIQQRLGSSWQAVNLNTILKNSDLTPSVQKHLVKVYLQLALGLLICAGGTFVGQYISLGLWVPALAYIGLSTWLLVTPPGNQKQRKQLFAGAAFAQGMTLAPLVQVALLVNSSILPIAVAATSVIFGCFTLAAAIAKRRSYLYLTAILSSAMSVMFWWRMGMSVFARGSTFGFEAELLVGLAVFLGYVLVDTQVIIEKASYGDLDETKHALQLFGDFIAIFVRILILLLQKQEREERKRRQRKQERSD